MDLGLKCNIALINVCQKAQTVFKLKLNRLKYLKYFKMCVYQS